MPSICSSSATTPQHIPTSLFFICGMEGGDGEAYACPSFSSYSSNQLAEVAAKVAVESSIAGDDDDFEFVLVQQHDAENSSFGGQIRPTYPVFSRDLVGGNEKLESSVAVPLSKLLIEDREDHEIENPPSCSSSEADELENVSADMYCFWRPKPGGQPSPSRCEKSKSTGSASRRWTFCDFLRRCNSEGKNSYVFLTPKKGEGRGEKSLIETATKVKVKPVRSGAGGSPSAHEALYVRNRAMKEETKKKSYLPYRQDIVGFFVNVNGYHRI